MSFIDGDNGDNFLSVMPYLYAPRTIENEGKEMTQEEQIKAMLDKLNTMLEYDEDIAVDSVDEIVDKFNKYVEENIS